MSSLAKRMPYGKDASVRKRQDLERTQREQAASRGLEASQIGAGGITVTDGGSIRIVGGGSIELDTGTFIALNVVGSSQVSAPVVVGTTSVIGADVYAQSIATNITAGRVAVWGRTSDGYLGTATSSQRFKTALQTLDLDDRAKRIVQITVGYFEYLAELAKRDDPASPDYVGPDYHVSVNLGAIAEQLDELGLWEWVIYEHEPVIRTMTDPDGSEHDVVVDERLRLDEDGHPIPYGIHDILIGWAALIVAQAHEKRITALETWASAQGFTGAAA